MVTITKYVDVSTEVEVEVDISLKDLDIEDVFELLHEKGYVTLLADIPNEELVNRLESLCELYRNKDSRFMKEIGVFLSDLTGRIL